VSRNLAGKSVFLELRQGAASPCVPFATVNSRPPGKPEHGACIHTHAHAWGAVLGTALGGGNGGATAALDTAGPWAGSPVPAVPGMLLRNVPWGAAPGGRGTSRRDPAENWVLAGNSSGWPLSVGQWSCWQDGGHRGVLPQRTGRAETPGIEEPALRLGRVGKTCPLSLVPCPPFPCTTRPPAPCKRLAAPSPGCPPPLAAPPSHVAPAHPRRDAASRRQLLCCPA